MSPGTGSDAADGTKSRIAGKEATYVAMAAAKYPPVKIDAGEFRAKLSGSGSDN